MSRALGIDYGRRRIGIAISDPTRTIATPVTTLERPRGAPAPIKQIARLAREREADELVIGLPLTLEGTDSDWTRETRRFGERLAKRTGLPAHYQDERLTSVRAERAVRSLGLKKRERERKSRVDRAAAVLILQSFLDQESTT